MGFVDGRACARNSHHHPHCPPQHRGVWPFLFDPQLLRSHWPHAQHTLRNARWHLMALVGTHTPPPTHKHTHTTRDRIASHAFSQHLSHQQGLYSMAPSVRRMAPSRRNTFVLVMATVLWPVDSQTQFTCLLPTQPTYGLHDGCVQGTTLFVSPFRVHTLSHSQDKPTLHGVA